MGQEQGRLLDTTTPEGVRTMDEQLQRKFAKGIQYNMKVVIRGDRNTGKTCLFHRMQGRSFVENYIPTSEIQVSSIHWSYPRTSDTAKIEIWDVVDKGKLKKGKGASLKLFNLPSKSAQEPEERPLDAEFLDVYKGTNGAIFVFDLTKQWTWQYITRELPQVPLHIPVLLLGNFRDLGEHRVVPLGEPEYFISSLERPDGAAEVTYIESCMKNGFGLRYLHKFLSIPFLQMQQESLLQQLKVNREQLLSVQEDLDESRNSQNYDEFLLQGQQPKPPSVPTTAEPASSHADNVPASEDKEEEGEEVDGQAATVTNTKPKTEERTVSSKFSKLSGFFGKSKGPSSQSPASRPAQKVTTPKQQKRSTSSANAGVGVDDFVPDGTLDDDFFVGGEDEEQEEEEDDDDDDDDSEDEDEERNPHVAADEDLSTPEEEEEEEKIEKESDEDEEEKEPFILTPQPAAPLRPVVTKPTVPMKSAKEIVLTESEEEEEEEDETATSKSTKQHVKHDWTTPPAASKKTSGGLLLEFASPRNGRDSDKIKRRDSDGSSKAKHKVKKSKKKEKIVEQESASASPSTAAKNSDPFGLTSSLDAWLMDEASTPPRTTQSIIRTMSNASEEVGEEAEEEEEKPRHHKKHKKHRDHSEGDRPKKKHKHKSRRKE